MPLAPPDSACLTPIAILRDGYAKFYPALIHARQVTFTTGGYSKHQRDDTLPSKHSTTQLLVRWRDGIEPMDPEHPIFTIPDKTARMIRADLSDAGIECRDADGRVCDFHAPRHSFVSASARGGVHPKVAQQLARHSTITLTMDRYSHSVVGELSDALTAFP